MLRVSTASQSPRGRMNQGGGTFPFVHNKYGYYLTGVVDENIA